MNNTRMWSWVVGFAAIAALLSYFMPNRRKHSVADRASHMGRDSVRWVMNLFQATMGNRFMRSSRRLAKSVIR